jgi:serine/threonine protein kinase/tetratricopeptide (TPR) repeat protein
MTIDIAGRYRLLDMLGEGGMGKVFRAEDRLFGRLVALKQVRLLFDPLTLRPPHLGAASADANTIVDRAQSEFRLALAQEFKILASLRHPNIVSVLDYGFDEFRQPYFVMELLSASQPITEAATYAAPNTRLMYLAQMVQALAYLHRRSILHRDLKPDNILVADQRVRLLDFGLSLVAGEGDHPDDLSGTLQYMAPELLDGKRASPQSDLFAAGVIAYEMFAGEHPFAATTLSDMVDRICNADPDLAALDAPAEVVNVIQRLLHKQPGQRFRSAQEALHALQAAPHAALDVEPPVIRESFLQASQFVGRDVELDHLMAGWRNTVGGRGAIWLIGGESGIGKSRLLDEFRTRTLVDGATVVSGQAARQGHPFQLWREVVARLALNVTLDTNTLSVLQLIAPTLSHILGVQLPPVHPQQVTEGQLQDALVTLLRHQPQTVVMLLEDIHLALSDLVILRRLALIIAELRLLIVCTYRSDELPALPDQLTEAHVLRLARLSEQETTQLVGSMVGHAPADLVSFLQRETEGNVFFLVEAVRTLAEEAGSLDNVSVHALPTHIFTGGVQQFIERRINRVSSAALPVLKVAAAVGRLIDLPVLERIDARFDLESWLLECSDAAIVEVRDEHWQFTHDKLREGVLNLLTDEERPRLYWQTASALEAVRSGDHASAGRIAAHWGMAGNPQREMHFSLLAAEHSLGVNLFSEAHQHASRALALCEQLGVDPETYLQAMATLARTTWHMADYAQAGPLLRRSIQLAAHLHRDTLRIDLTLALGELLRRQGRADEGQQMLQAGYWLAVERGDQAQVATALLRQVTPVLDLGWDVVRDKVEQALVIYRAIGDELGQARAALRKAMILAEPHEADEARQLLNFAGEVLKSHHERTSYVEVLRLMAAQYVTDGNLHQADQLAREGLRAARETGGKRQVAAMLQLLGAIANRLDNLAEAEAYNRDAAAIFRDMNEVAFLAYTLASLGQILHQRDQLTAAQKALEEALALAHQHDIHEIELTALTCLAKVYSDRGSPDIARRCVRQGFELARDGSITLEKAYLLEACLYVDEHAGDYAQAALIASFLTHFDSGDEFLKAAAAKSLTRLLALLPADQREPISQDGSRLSVEEMIARAISNASRGAPR